VTRLRKLQLFVGFGAALAAGACLEAGEHITAGIIGVLGVVWFGVLGEKRDG
jgi:hypothetical protein